LKHIYAQLIDDEQGRTLVGVSSLTPEIRATNAYGGNIDAAKAVGKLIGQKAREKNITRVIFDRAGYKYHGRIAALADAAREEGIEF
jgi:large subunit ribosomal protein L18